MLPELRCLRAEKASQKVAHLLAKARHVTHRALPAPWLIAAVANTLHTSATPASPMYISRRAALTPSHHVVGACAPNRAHGDLFRQLHRPHASRLGLHRLPSRVLARHRQPKLSLRVPHDFRDGVHGEALRARIDGVRAFAMNQRRRECRSTLACRWPSIRSSIPRRWRRRPNALVIGCPRSIAESAREVRKLVKQVGVSGLPLGAPRGWIGRASGWIGTSRRAA